MNVTALSTARIRLAAAVTANLVALPLGHMPDDRFTVCSGCTAHARAADAEKEEAHGLSGTHYRAWTQTNAPCTICGQEAY